MSAQECTLDDTDCKSGEQAAWVHGSSSAVIFVGAIIGQLSMGYLGDIIGRNKALVFTLLIATLTAFLSAVAPTDDAYTVYSTIIAMRFFLGVGLGGIFPLSATKSSEDQGNSIGQVNPVGAAWTYFWQMPGIMGPWFVGYIVSSRGSLSTSYQWRLILGLGAIPCLLSMIGLIIERHISPIQNDLTEKLEDNNANVKAQPESVNPMVFYDVSNDRDTFQTITSDHTTVSKKTEIFESFMNPTYIKYMISSGGTWLLFDIVAFGVSLSGGEIINAISDSDDDNISSTSHIQFISSRQLIASSMGIPGTIIAILLLPHLGLKNLQIFSFIFQTVCALLLAVLFNSLSSDALFILYCILTFSIQSGVNITAFALPSALYPKQVRSTYNGIASALGKVGAVIGSYSFNYIAEDSSYAVVMGISCVIAVIGAI
eukprot:gene18609-24338_t